MIERRANEKIKMVLNIISILIFVGGIITASIVYANSQSDLRNDIDRTIEQDIIQDLQIEKLESKQAGINDLLIEIGTDVKWIKKQLGAE